SGVPLVIVPFPDEGPIPVPKPFKVFFFDPARVFVSVPSSCPSPQTREDSVIHAGERAFAHHVPMIISQPRILGLSSSIRAAAEEPSAAFIVLRTPSRKVLTFFLEGLMSSFPFGYLRTFCPRKSKPFSTCVMTVFVGESSSPRFCRN